MLDSQELHEFSVTLFDNEGRLKPDLMSHPIRKGSGMWGNELNKGALIFVESVAVESAHRRKGLANFMVDQTLSHPIVQTNCLLLAVLYRQRLDDSTRKEEHG